MRPANKKKSDKNNNNKRRNKQECCEGVKLTAECSLALQQELKDPPEGCVHKNSSATRT